MAQEIIFITSSFPLGKGEPFLDLEYKYLKNYGIKATFLVKNTNTLQIENQPDDEINLVQRVRPTGKAIIKALANSKVREELLKCYNRYSPKKYKIITKIALASYINAVEIKNKLEQLLETKGDHVILYSYWCDDAAIAIALLKNHPKVKRTITRTHRWDLYFNAHKVPYLPFRKLIQENVTAIVPIAEDAIQEIKDAWRVPINNVIVSKLGVYQQNTIPAKTNDLFTIVSCSNIIPVKRVQLLAKAIMQLPNKVRWIHFGDGPDRNEVEKIISNNTKHLIELKGYVNNQQILDFYASEPVNIFINVSYSEGIPVSIMEAMSFSIPVIATNVGGSGEIVNDSNGIILHRDSTPKTVAEAITSMMSLSKEEYNKLSDNAYKTWQEEYNAEKNFNQFAKEILKISYLTDK